MAATPLKKTKKGKRHPTHAASFAFIAADLMKQRDEATSFAPVDVLNMVISALKREAKRVRTIVR